VHDGSFETIQDDGPLLAGEYVRGSAGLTVRFQSGRWSLTTVAESASGRPALLRDTRFESVARLPEGRTLPGRGLHYHVGYLHHEQAGWRPAFARFTGFGE